MQESTVISSLYIPQNGSGSIYYLVITMKKKKKKELHVISGQISFSHPYIAESKQ